MGLRDADFLLFVMLQKCNQRYQGFSPTTLIVSECGVSRMASSVMRSKYLALWDAFRVMIQVSNAGESKKLRCMGHPSFSRLARLQYYMVRKI